MTKMKYSKQLYIGSGIYDGDRDDDIRCHKEKIVKCRKMHQCSSCGEKIGIREQALLETGFMDGEAISCYTCLPCIESWLEESGQVEEEEEEKEVIK